MKKTTDPFPAILPLFRYRPLQQFLSGLLLTCFIPLLGGCNYYRIKEEKTVNTEKMASLPNYKRFILHQGENSWELKEVAVQEKALTGKLHDITESLLPYVDDKAGSPHRYKPANKGTALNMVHLYVYEFSQDHNNQAFIPISAIKRMDITDKDTGATVASYVFTTIGSLAAAFGVLSVIVLLFKSSCPFVYVYTGSAYQFVGEAYGGAIFAPLERDDYMPLQGWQAVAGTVQVKIANELKERQYTNLAELQVVQHPVGVQVLLDQQGRPHTLQQVQAPHKALASDGINYAGALASQDSSAWVFNSTQSNNNYVKLQFRKPAGSQTAKLMLHAQNSLWLDYLYGAFTRQFGSLYNHWAEKQQDVPATALYRWQQEQGIPLLVEVRTAKGWQVVERIPPVGPLAGRNLVVPVDLADVKGEVVQVRLSCGFMFWEVDRAGMDFSPNLPVEVEKVKASSAYEKLGQNVRQLVAATDGKYLEQFSVGDAVVLTFPLPQKKPGQAHTLFLHTRGYYEHIREYAGIPNLMTLRAFEKPGHFMQFSRDRYAQLAEENNFHNLVTAHAPTR
jgi:hypothetical protein